jgi:surface protein
MTGIFDNVYRLNRCFVTHWCKRDPTQSFRATNHTLREAVNIWCEDVGTALVRYGPINNWDTSAVTDMSKLFETNYGFNDDISDWDTSQVTDMSYMFYLAFQFNQPIEPWDVSKVTKMTCMFWEASSFNQPLDKWNVVNVQSMDCMFLNASSFRQKMTLGLWKKKHKLITWW